MMRSEAVGGVKKRIPNINSIGKKITGSTDPIFLGFLKGFWEAIGDGKIAER